MKKKPPKTPSQLKKELDRVFSLYIRMKHPPYCYTCNNPNNLQCGHFVSRLYLATRWDEDNARPQCVGCNMFGGGKPLDFEEHLIAEIGKRRVEALKQRRHMIVKLSPAWYEEQIQKYKGMV